MEFGVVFVWNILNLGLLNIYKYIGGMQIDKKCVKLKIPTWFLEFVFQKKKQTVFIISNNVAFPYDAFFDFYSVRYSACNQLSLVFDAKGRKWVLFYITLFCFKASSK